MDRASGPMALDNSTACSTTCLAASRLLNLFVLASIACCPSKQRFGAHAATRGQIFNRRYHHQEGSGGRGLHAAKQLAQPNYTLYLHK